MEGVEQILHQAEQKQASLETAEWRTWEAQLDEAGLAPATGASMPKAGVADWEANGLSG